ncbi:bifunctional metallophosphatase/5'-nucleotidase [Mediterraneibacter gnavus]|uniref:bifunctional metallophosphatase/5'-nucleotidase n=1 Tax=Mediterraneibacter gnavus TaxID=33038 RepID=UPI0032B77E82
MNQIRIIFTSDIHGYFYPTDYTDRIKKAKGLLHIAQYFHKDGNTMILDGGDTLQGSPFSYYSQMKEIPEVAAELMNKAGYDVVTLGNHDFNYGSQYLHTYLEHLKAVCVCENCTNKKNGKSLFPWRVFQMENGIRIGVVGAVTDFINIWEKKENLEQMKIDSTYESVVKAYEEVKNQADFTICLYHGGMECDIDTEEILETTGENVGYKICKNLGFDLLLTGHQHMPITGRKIHGTYVVQNMSNADTYHEIQIEFDSVVRIQSKMISASELPLRESEFPFWNVERNVQNWLDSVVGHIPEDLYPEEHLKMALYGSKLADFINEAQQAYTGAEISCTSLANQVHGIPKEVKVRDILLTYPFPNTLVVLEITGKLLKEALEHSAEYFTVKEGRIQISERFLKPKEEHYNFDFYKGVTYQIDYNRPIGRRISEIRVQKQLVSPEKTYRICMNNYRASGAGGYKMYTQGKIIRQYGKDIFEVLLEYINNYGKNYEL